MTEPSFEVDLAFCLGGTGHYWTVVFVFGGFRGAVRLGGLGLLNGARYVQKPSFPRHAHPLLPCFPGSISPKAGSDFPPETFWGCIEIGSFLGERCTGSCCAFSFRNFGPFSGFSSVGVWVRVTF